MISKVLRDRVSDWFYFPLVSLPVSPHNVQNESGDVSRGVADVEPMFELLIDQLSKIADALQRDYNVEDEYQDLLLQQQVESLTSGTCSPTCLPL